MQLKEPGFDQSSSNVWRETQHTWQPEIVWSLHLPLRTDDLMDPLHLLGRGNRFLMLSNID